MVDMLVKTVEMKAALWLNSFFYYFRRLWLVGRLMPETIYANTALKKVLSYVAVAVQQLSGFFSKPLYLLVRLAAGSVAAGQAAANGRAAVCAVCVHFVFFRS